MKVIKVEYSEDKKVAEVTLQRDNGEEWKATRFYNGTWIAPDDVAEGLEKLYIVYCTTEYIKHRMKVIRDNGHYGITIGE